MKDKPSVALAKTLFDAEYYSRTYPEIASAVPDLASEYLSVGWRQGRNPSATFDTRYYLENNPDVRKSGECPLVHYVRLGAAQGRLPSPRPFIIGEVRPKPAESPQPDKISPARAVINRAASPRKRAQDWRGKPVGKLADPSRIGDILTNLVSQGRTKLILSFSHDDYAKVDGGIQNCVSDEEKELRKAGWVYVHVCPAVPLPMLADAIPAAEFLVSVRIQSDLVGVVRFADLVREIAKNRSHVEAFKFVIHHLMGFSPELITEAAGKLAPDDVIFWLHDFFTLCSNYALLRNDLEFCHAPDVGSQVCRICCYGTERKGHIARMRAAFEALSPTVLAPSETALSFWKRHQDMRFKAAAVVPHGKLVLNSAPISREHKSLRVGFLGAPFYNKGWHTFEALAARHQGDSRYSFFHLGVNRGNPSRNIEFVEVSIKEQGRQAMIKAVAELGLDVVVNWSLCYETFSFTAHEAIAGGAFVIARKGAGNVWPAVNQPGVERGYALDDEDELFELFASGSVEKLIKKKHYADLDLNAATATYLLKDKAHV